MPPARKPRVGLVEEKAVFRCEDGEPREVSRGWDWQSFDGLVRGTSGMGGGRGWAAGGGWKKLGALSDTPFKYSSSYGQWRMFSGDIFPCPLP